MEWSGPEGEGVEVKIEREPVKVVEYKELRLGKRSNGNVWNYQSVSEMLIKGSFQVRQ